MNRDIMEAERIVVNAEHSSEVPALLIVFPDEILTIQVIHIPAMLVIIQALESEKKFKVGASTDSLTILIPYDEEYRDTPPCSKCGSICVESTTGFYCLHCGSPQ